MSQLNQTLSYILEKLEKLEKTLASKEKNNLFIKQELEKLKSNKASHNTQRLSEEEERTLIDKIKENVPIGYIVLEAIRRDSIPRQYSQLEELE